MLWLSSLFDVPRVITLTCIFIFLICMLATQHVFIIISNKVSLNGMRKKSNNYWHMLTNFSNLSADYQIARGWDILQKKTQLFQPRNLELLQYGWKKWWHMLRSVNSSWILWMFYSRAIGINSPFSVFMSSSRSDHPLLHIQVSHSKDQERNRGPARAATGRQEIRKHVRDGSTSERADRDPGVWVAFMSPTLHVVFQF